MYIFIIYLYYLYNYILFIIYVYKTYIYLYNYINIYDIYIFIYIYKLIMCIKYICLLFSHTYMKITASYRLLEII
jgi:hypothetical protein